MSSLVHNHGFPKTVGQGKKHHNGRIMEFIAFGGIGFIRFIIHSFFYKKKMGPCNSASVKPTSNGTSARKNTLTNRPDLAHDLAGTQINPPACDTGPTSLINATNNIVSIAIAKSISNCFADQIALQNTRIKCKPRVPEDITVFEANAACGQCIQNILLASQR